MTFKECFQAIRSLRSNNKILITIPDKDAGVVILNKHDYVSKMDMVLHDASKFLKQSLKTDGTNSKVQNFLLNLILK